MTKKKKLKIFFFTFVLALILMMKAFSEERYSDLQNFTKVLNLIQQYYVENVDSKKLVYGAIKGMLRELDPHSNFLPPEIFKDFENETSGEFGGLGVEISIQNSLLTVISPIEDTPAWNAGVKAGDKIVAINGTSTKNLSLAETSQLLKGKRGTAVTLTIVRETVEKPLEIKIVRGSVKIKSVKHTSLDDGYHYIKLTSFIENTSPDLQKILDELSRKSESIRGLIIDLRRNPGGLLEQAVKVSDFFLSEGVIVTTMGRDPKNKEVTSATKRGKYLDFPMILLVNEHSASAAEIFAGAMQDNQRAIIMGQRTFGKGSVQSVIKLGDESGLKLTVARYYTPKGRSIQAEGITPDIEVEEVDSEMLNKAVIKPKGGREKDISGHLLGETEKTQRKSKDKPSDTEVTAWWKEVITKKSEELSQKDKLLTTDYQIYQAYNYLKAWKIMKKLQTK